MKLRIADLRLAARTLARTPLFTLLAWLTLTLGIGATTTIYSAVDAVLVRALPYPDSGRLVALWVDARANDMPRQEWTNPADVADWRAGLRSVDAVAAYTGWTPTLTGRGDAQMLIGARVQRDYFDVLGIAPLLGRGFAAEEDVPNGPAVVVVSHGFWQQQLGGAQTLGQRIDLGGVPHAVVGVMPAGFAGPLSPGVQLWRPLQMGADGRGNAFLRVIARLAPGATVAAAQDEFDALQRQLAERYPDTNRGLGGYVQPLHELVGETVRSQLLVLLGATAFVLLIACANLANLLLARASGRARELAVRASLGASRARIAGQLLAESALLSAGGAVGGLVFAAVALQALAGALPDAIVQVAPPAVDARVAAFAVAVATLCGVLFGVAPALGTARLDLNQVMRNGERGSSGRGAPRARAALVVATFAFALALCSGAGLFLKSLWQLQQTDPGFGRERVLAVNLQLPPARYADEDALRRAYAELERRVGALAGVEAVGLSSNLPLGSNNSDTMIYLDGALQPDARKRLWYSQVSPGYLDALGVALHGGRAFAQADRNGAGVVGIVNEAFVRDYLGGAAAVGTRFALEPLDAPVWVDVVGVAADVRYFGIDTAQTPSAYVPLAQYPSRNLYIVLKSAGEPLALVPALRRAIAEFDPLLALSTPMTMQARIDDALRGPRMVAALTAGFAALALLLSALGVYGVVAHAVATRTREFGVRLALGATAQRLLRLVMRSGVRLALAGVAVGVVLSLALGRLLAGLLYEVSPFDPVVLLAVASLLALVALAACLLPALRALRVPPMAALRYE